MIADHTRAVTYMLSDGVVPSNVGRGYVVRRLLRRVVLKGRLLGLRKPFVAAVAQAAVKLSGGCDPAVEANWEKMVKEEISREEERFTATITAGSVLLSILQRPHALILHCCFGILKQVNILQSSTFRFYVPGM